VEALKGSSRLAEYAKRTELIELSPMRDGGEYAEDLLQALFEMCRNAKTLSAWFTDLSLSTIGKSPVLKSAPQTLTWDCS
jgi:hypothetical protein